MKWHITRLDGEYKNHRIYLEYKPTSKRWGIHIENMSYKIITYTETKYLKDAKLIAELTIDMNEKKGSLV